MKDKRCIAIDRKQTVILISHVYCKQRVTCKSISVKTDRFSDSKDFLALRATLIPSTQTPIKRTHGSSQTGCTLSAGLLQVTDVNAIGAGQTDEVLVAVTLEVVGSA